MITKRSASRWLILVAGLLLTEGLLAGSLTPPGPPGDTMKTLDEVEPRIMLSSAPVAITNPGSYYLTRNLTGTVTIAANNVTLDLMGYAIVAGSGNALSQSGTRTNLLVRNGILSAPTGNGADFSTSKSGANGLLEDLRVSECGLHGLAVSADFVVRRCRISNVALAGIRVYGDSQILDNTVTDCGTGLHVSGTGALVAGNVVKGNSDNYNFASGNQLNLLLCELPEDLDWPCSVKLAGSLTCPGTGTNGITVRADHVTIDLDGHALIGSGSASHHGIYQGTGYKNLAVKNGTLTEWMGSAKVSLYAQGAYATLENLTALTNYNGLFTGDYALISDCRVGHSGYNGMVAGYYSLVENCQSHDNIMNGIILRPDSTIKDSIFFDNGSSGINGESGCTLIRCRALNNHNDGLYVGTESVIRDCQAIGNGDNGIVAGDNSSIAGSVAQLNGGDGYYINSDSLVQDCIANNNGISGFFVYGYDSRIQENQANDNLLGVNVALMGNLIIRNSCSGNTTNWVIVGNNKVGTIVSAPNSAAISGSTGGAGLGSTDPWANFSF